MISISELVDDFKEKGIALTKGDARVHLRYLGKLGLIPFSKKKRVGKVLEGHYPEWVAGRLETIAGLKKQGLTYTQIKILLEVQNRSLAEQAGRESRSLETVDNREFGMPTGREIGVNRLFLMLNTAVLLISLLVLSRIAAGNAGTQVVVVPTKDYGYLFNGAANQEPLRLVVGGERKIVKTDLE